jgi:hypothetical protein
VPDPTWTSQYNLAQTPEANGFTRTLYDNPVVNAVTGGSPANRRVEINSDAGSCVFVTSAVPSLDGDTGVTAEVVVASSGSGNAGFEVTFLDRAIGVQVYADRITVADGLNEPASFPTAANTANTTVRLTYQSGTARVYRNGTLLATLTPPFLGMPFQRVLWWGEEGGTQVWRALRYWSGGAMAPG